MNRRNHYAIGKLPAEIRRKIDNMLKSDCTYSEIADYIKSTGNSVSKSAIQRYSANLMDTIQTLRITQENFKAIMSETEKYNDVDFTEPIIRILCGLILEQISKNPEKIDIDAIVKNTVALTRASAYKYSVQGERKSKDDTPITNFFEVITEQLKEK